MKTWIVCLTLALALKAQAQFHSFGAAFGGPPTAVVGQPVILFGEMQNHDDFPDTHLWLSFTIDIYGTNTGNLVGPGVVYRTGLHTNGIHIPPEAVLQATTNEIRIGPASYATIQFTFTPRPIDAGARLEFYGMFEGVDLGAGPLGATLGHSLQVLPQLEIRRFDDNELQLHFLIPAGRRMQLLQSDDLREWSVTRTYGVGPLREARVNFPYGAPQFYFQLRLP